MPTTIDLIEATEEFFQLHWSFDYERPLGVPIPMRKPPTGEPCAGEPPTRFGGRGGR